MDTITKKIADIVYGEYTKEEMAHQIALLVLAESHTAHMAGINRVAHLIGVN